MGDPQTTTNDREARVKTAEAYESHGLYNEALEVYQQILSELPESDSDLRGQIQEKVEKLSSEITDEDQPPQYDFSSEDVNYIKTGLSIGESAPEIQDSANAFKELGLYKEAVAEFCKLFNSELELEDFMQDLIESLLEVYTPAEAVEEIEGIAKENSLDNKTEASIKFSLGQELDQRGSKDDAVKCYKAVQKIDPIYPKLKEKLESVQPEQKYESRYDYLLKNGIVSTTQLQKALSLAKKMKKSVEFVLMDQFKIDKQDIGKSLSAYYNCSFRTFNPGMEVPYELISNLKKPFLLQDLWVPVRWEVGYIEILMDDPKDLRKLDHAKALFNTNKFMFSVGIKEDIEAIISHFFTENKNTQGLKTGSAAAAPDIEDMPEIYFEEEEQEEEVEDAYDEASGKVVRLVDQVLISAYRKNASDIHIEPSSATKRTKIRFRIDGVCQDFLEVPNSFSNAILSRIKIMSNLDIAEKRLPQDGKIKFKRKGVPEFELRVATMPTAGGHEDVVLRILATSGAMAIEELGLTERNYKLLKGAISKPYGIILCVGPTGSGKTTTLHSALHYINTPERKIWTAEDPVEITQYGLRQVEVKNKIGLDFARIMRSFLRADPDVIMVGEMRDYETASIGIEASLTGHLVFTTLHTNSAPETITRLLDMGLNPLNFSDAFLVVLAQRLVRRLCKKCRMEYTPSREEFDELVADYGPEEFKRTGIEYSSDLRLYKPVGCEHCNGTGYKGRMGIHELMDGSREIKRMIKKQASTEELYRQAKQEGMTTLMQDGIMKVFQGYTDISEVRRVCITA